MAHRADHDQHLRQVIQHVGVGEPQDPEPQSSEDRVTLRVGSGLIRVVNAIDLHHHARLDATEVDDVPDEHMLTSEVKTAEPVVADGCPEPSFGRCRLTPQFSGAGELERRGPGRAGEALTRCHVETMTQNVRG